MKKSILSLTAVATLFAGVPVYASTVVDSTLEVSASSVSNITEPQIKIERLATLDVPRNSISFVDGRNLSGEYEQSGNLDNTVNKGETKRFQRYQLAKGQKLTTTIEWYIKYFPNNTSKNGWDDFVKNGFKPVQRIEKTIEEDGYYAIDLVAPSNQSNVNQYHVVYNIQVQ